MNKKLLISLRHLLLLIETTLSISHVSFVEELSDEQTLDIMESLLESYKLLLDAIRKGVVTVSAIDKSVNLLYELALEVLDSLLLEGSLDVNNQARLEDIKSSLESISEGTGECVCIKDPPLCC